MFLCPPVSNFLDKSHLLHYHYEYWFDRNHSDRKTSEYVTHVMFSTFWWSYTSLKKELMAKLKTWHNYITLRLVHDRALPYMGHIPQHVGSFLGTRLICEQDHKDDKMLPLSANGNHLIYSNLLFRKIIWFAYLNNFEHIFSMTMCYACNFYIVKMHIRK